MRMLLGINQRNPRHPLFMTARAPVTLNPQSARIQLAQVTGVVFSWVYEILDELQARGITSPSNPLQVADAAAAFAWWAENRTVPTVSSFHVADPLPLASRLLSDGQVPNALTTYYAENRYQGHLFPRRLDAYVRLDQLHTARQVVLDAGGQLGGTNFRLFAGDDGILEERVLHESGPLRLAYAPIPQVILDLIHEGGSAREAADLMINREFPHATNARL